MTQDKDETPIINISIYHRDLYQLLTLLLADEKVAMNANFKNLSESNHDNEVNRLLIWIAIATRQLLDIKTHSIGLQVCGQFCKDFPDTGYTDLTFRQACNAIIHAVEILSYDPDDEETTTEGAWKADYYKGNVMCDFFSSMAIPLLSYLWTQTDRAYLGGITIMYKIEEFVIAIYCLIEDELYPAFLKQHGLPRRAGFPPALSDSECLTVELVGQYLGYTSQKQLYAQMHDRFGAWFPALRDRSAFTRQCANLWQVKAFMHHHLVERLGGLQADCQIIDTLPLPICHRARRFQRRIFRTESVGGFPAPTLGYCAAKDEYYFGFKGGLRITDYGLIVHAPLLAAQGHDSTCRDALLAGLQAPTQVIGDAAFLALERQQELQQHHIHLLTPLKRNMQPTDPRKPFVAPEWASRIRRRIETIYAQLVQRFHVQTMKVRDAWHLQSLWTTKILTHTLCVGLNIRLKREPLDFDGLVQM